MPVERVPRADLQKVAHDIESGGGLITAITTDDGYFVIAWIKRPDGAYEHRVSEWLGHQWPQQVLGMMEKANFPVRIPSPVPRGPNPGSGGESGRYNQRGGDAA